MSDQPKEARFPQKGDVAKVFRFCGEELPEDERYEVTILDTNREKGDLLVLTEDKGGEMRVRPASDLLWGQGIKLAF